VTAAAAALREETVDARTDLRDTPAVCNTTSTAAIAVSAIFTIKQIDASGARSTFVARGRASRARTLVHPLGLGKRLSSSQRLRSCHKGSY